MLQLVCSTVPGKWSFKIDLADDKQHISYFDRLKHQELNILNYSNDQKGVTNFIHDLTEQVA